MTEAKVARAERVADSREVPIRAHLLRSRVGLGIYTPCSCKAFARLVPVERDWVIIENKMCMREAQTGSLCARSHSTMGSTINGCTMS
jgi:hypothetical protein